MFKNIIKRFRYTIVHPQWLLGRPNDILKLVRANATGLVLDIGCADEWIKTYLPPQCSYFALDYPATGQALYAARPAMFADAANLPLADASVDTVLLLEVLEHLPEPRQSLAEIKRVLKPGGKLIMSMPFLYPTHDAPHDYQRYTLHGLEHVLKSAGLQCASIQSTSTAMKSAGLLLCLALAGVMLQALKRRSMAMILLPLLLLAIPFINCSFWLLAKVCPNWPAFSAGYQLVATR